mmetsp:Transcript_17061/g.46786  ORF Transcript_17061/g.46786 Transcript_17061/m.46786 type:complete len:968 (-) Transcript_17061:85-2988(-)
MAKLLTAFCMTATVGARLADRSRIVKLRQANGQISKYHDNGRPIEGQAYRSRRRDDEEETQKRLEADARALSFKKNQKDNNKKKDFAPWKLDLPEGEEESPEDFERKLSSQLTGCCYTYSSYYADGLCAVYGYDCDEERESSHDSGDQDCSQDGLSFIGVSFSVNTANGNPYSYHLNDQFPMENIIDRDYEYVMSMDEDGWLVGGGYKAFDYSGKMPYIDSSHTELLRIGNMNPDKGGTSIYQVYAAMEAITFAPISVYPEYLKGGGGHHSGDNGDDDGVPSGDITLIVSVVETYEDGGSKSSYETFLESLFDALDSYGGGPCMDDHDTDPHVSMSRGVKFWSSYHQQQYMYSANLEVAVWQSIYSKGVVIGSTATAAFPPGRKGTRYTVGYGNLYFFFDRANITKAFSPNRELYDSESYYSTLYSSGDVSNYYSSTTTINFDYSGSGDNNDGNYEWNPYSWDQLSAMHDMTDGWELPPNCLQEGETFFGIPLSRASGSKLQSSSTFQDVFDFEYLVDRNGTYIQDFGTNHGWLIGETLDNAVGSIVDKDTAHIPIFYTGTTNPEKGGLSLSDLIKIARKIDFGTLYIKPAFVFLDDDGHAKLQFEADTQSALAYLYDSLCKELGITWNYESPSNSLGVYTSCSMHAAGDRAKYGCGPDGYGSGGFCPQMTLAYAPKFVDGESSAAYLARSNAYVDYWRSLYPNGVAVGTKNFCKDGGCLGLYLNRLDLYEVFKPDLGGSWVEYNGASMPPTYSPAPTWEGGCSEPHNMHLDKCFYATHKKPRPSAIVWDALGSVGQVSIVLVVLMACTLSLSIFLARARKKRRRGESYLGFFFRDLTRRRRKRRKGGPTGLADGLIKDDGDNRSRRSKSAARSTRSLSKSRKRSKSISGSSRRSGSRSVRSVSVQPESSSSSRRSSSRASSRGRKSRERGGSESRSSRTSRTGVFDLSITSPQNKDDSKDNRQQLV